MTLFVSSAMRELITDMETDMETLNGNVLLIERYIQNGKDSEIDSKTQRRIQELHEQVCETQRRARQAYRALERQRKVNLETVRHSLLISKASIESNILEGKAFLILDAAKAR